MIYYKAFNRDLQCRGFQYKEGETYEIKEDPILCERGFHFCKDLVLTIEYYPCSKITDNLYAEVEILGETVFEEPTKHKGVTNKIKIKRVLTDEEVLSFVDKHSNSGHWNSGHWNSGHRNSGHSNSGNRNSGDSNSGNRNSGDSNSGNRNSGNRNSGHSNSGHRNSGHRNSGDRNSGHRNSGHSNSGDSNSGHSNSGDRNSGHWNSGDRNSGHWNSTSYESGHFNSVKAAIIRVFNKYISASEWENAYKPSFLYFTLESGKSYKECFIESWEKADKIDRERVRMLPGFDAEVFFEISGIDLRNG